MHTQNILLHPRKKHVSLGTFILMKAILIEVKETDLTVG